jgi:hypothetical protein
VLNLLKRPTGFLPIAISVAFLVPLSIELLNGTLVRQPDEGTAAHLFQIFIPLQLVVIAWFAVTWLPKRAHCAAPVLGLQGFALLSVLAIVYFKHL